MRQRMPDGWVSIKWKDRNHHTWVSNVPKGIKNTTISKIWAGGGRVVKVTE